MMVAGTKGSIYILKIQLTDRKDRMEGGREREESRINVSQFWSVNLKEETANYGDGKRP